MKNKEKDPNRADYRQLKAKLYMRLLVTVVIALCIIAVIYTVIWHGRGGNWVVYTVFERLFGMNTEAALDLYQRIFRNNKDVLWIAAIALVFFILFHSLLNRFTQYFDVINQGINALLDENEAEIHLQPEMLAIERKLNTVKQTLKQRTLEAQLAEQRKNDLVMYLAHDIRTPLTSVIGYLSLLEEAPDMPAEQKAKYVHITLDKAYRLEKMINEFFEITRYNLQQISVSEENIDLYYMLVQLMDEASPILSENGNTAKLLADENLNVYGDPDQLARVFNNVLKNAAVYSYPNTEILISAKEEGQSVIITFQNQGKTIPEEKLAMLFENSIGRMKPEPLIPAAPAWALQ